MADPKGPRLTRLTRRELLRITAFAGAAAALGGIAGVDLLRRARLHHLRESRIQLGTRMTLEVVHDDPVAARHMIAAGFEEVERLESILSRHRPETALSELNRKGRLVGPPAELVSVLDAALAYARASGGAFDPTVAPLLALHAGAGGMPDLQRLAEALDRVDHAAVVLGANEIRFDRREMAITLDGIGKGYVLDAAAATLTSAGADRVFVEAGGDLATRGSAAEGPWRVAIQDPRNAGRHRGILTVHGSVATSGDYVQSFTPDLENHHILDPRTGRSPRLASSVTVAASSAMAADALSTAAFVLGPEEGIELLEHVPGAEGLILDKAGRESVTSGFNALRFSGG